MEPRSFYYSCTPEADRETQFESFRSMGAHESEIFMRAQKVEPQQSGDAQAHRPA